MFTPPFMAQRKQMMMFHKNRSTLKHRVLCMAPKKKTEKKKERRRARDAEERNRTKAILALVEMGRSLDSLPKDLAAVIRARRILGAIVSRYFELEKSGVFRWLLQFEGFKERLLADDLFLTKVAIE